MDKSWHHAQSLWHKTGKHFMFDVKWDKKLKISKNISTGKLILGTSHLKPVTRQFIERQFIERQFIEPTVYRTDSLSNDSLLNRQLIGFVKLNTSVLNAHMQWVHRILLYPIKRFNCTHRCTRRGVRGAAPWAWKFSGQTLFSGQPQGAEISWM